MTKEILENQDAILKVALREGALSDAWYNNWKKKVYGDHNVINEETLNVSFGNLDLDGMRLWNSLNRANLKTIGDLIKKYPPQDLYRIPGLGEKTHNELIEILSIRGITATGNNWMFKDKPAII